MYQYKFEVKFMQMDEEYSLYLYGQLILSNYYVL